MLCPKFLSLCIVLLLTQQVSWAGFGDFLIRSDIEVEQSGSSSVVGGERYPAHDSVGNQYQVRLNTGSAGYAEIGSSILIEQLGLPNLPIYPVLFDHSRNGLLQPTVLLHILNLKEHAKDLTGKQIAELVGHILAHSVLGDQEISLWNGKEGSVGFDGKHFYTLDVSQSFKFDPESHRHPSVGAVLQRLQAKNHELFKSLESKKAEEFSKELNLILTRIEKLGEQKLNPALQSYFEAANQQRKKAGLVSFDFESQLKTRIQSLRSEVISALPDFASALKTPDPTIEAVQSVEYPLLSLSAAGPIPSAKGQSSEDLLWGYYFQNSEEQRHAVEAHWANEFELPQHEIILALINLAPSKRAIKEEFQLEKEFPNYYMKSSHPPKEIQQALALAMKSLLSRLEVPFEKDGEIQRRGFFQYLVDSAKNVDPGAQVYISGGVVRSILGYLYQVVYNKMQKNPKQDAWNILTDFSRATAPIDPTRVLGVGSDFDVLVTPSEGDPGQNLIQLLHQKINSARRHLRLENDKDPVVNTLIPYGDTNLYSEQIKRSIDSGGNTIDYLAFHLEKNEFKEPDELPGIVKDYIRGEMNYLPGKSDVTTIRGIRSLLELLYVRYKKSGEQQLNQEVDALIKSMGPDGKSLSSSARVQFEKATRNARRWGAHNRIFESQDPVEEKIRNLIYSLGAVNEKNLLIIPKFTPKIKGSQKGKKAFPESLLMNVEKFKGKYTQNGILFHGTPKCEYMLAMIRNGFVRSGDEGGTAAKGPGTYITREYDTASTYSGNNGCVIPLTLRQGISPKILEWDTVKKHPFILQVIEEAKKQGMHEFLYLAQVYGIDIIVHEHVIVENTAVLKLPKNFSEVIKTQFEIILSRYIQTQAQTQKKNLDVYEFKKSLNQYAALYQLAHAAKLEGIHSPLDLIIRAVEEIDPAQGKLYREIIRDGDPKIIQDFFESSIQSAEGSGNSGALSLILSYAFLHSLPSPLHLLKVALQQKNPDLARIIAKQAISFPYPENIQVTKEALKASDSSIRYAAAEGIVIYSGPEQHSLIQMALDHEDPEVHLKGCAALKNYSGDEKVPLLKKLFQDPNEKGRTTALWIILESGDLDQVSLLDEFLKAQEPVSFEELNRRFGMTLDDSMEYFGQSIEKFYACLTHKNSNLSNLMKEHISRFPWSTHPQAKTLLRKVYELYKSNSSHSDLAHFDLAHFDLIRDFSKRRYSKNFQLAYEVFDRSDQIELLLHQDREVDQSIDILETSRLGIPSDQWQYGLALLANRIFSPLPVAEHEQRVKDYFAKFGLNPEVWTRRKDLLGAGRVNAPDAFEPKYFEQTAEILAQEVRSGYETPDSMRKSFSVRFKNAVPYQAQLLKTPAFRKLIEENRVQVSKIGQRVWVPFHNLLELGDTSEATSQALIGIFKINDKGKEDLLSRDVLIQFCSYLKEASHPDFHSISEEIDTQIEKYISSIGYYPGVFKSLNESSCISEFRRTRHKIKEFSEVWVEGPSEYFFKNWVGIGNVLFNSIHPELWHEEIELLKSSFERHVQKNSMSLDFRTMKEILPLFSKIEGHDDWKQRQVPFLKAALHRLLEDPYVDWVEFAKMLIELPGSSSLWKEERQLMIQKFQSKLQDGQLHYYQAAFLGRLLELDSEDRSNQESYQNLRFKVHEFLKKKNWAEYDWINTSFIALLSPFAQDWKEEHEKLRVRLREILQYNETMKAHSLAFMAQLLLESKPAAAWKEERKLIRDLLLKKIGDRTLYESELQFILQLLNRDRGDLDSQTALKEIYPHFSTYSIFSRIDALLAWSDLYYSQYSLKDRPDFQNIKDKLNEMMDSNVDYLIEMIGSCFYKDERVDAFRSEAHRWLLKATPWQRKQFVFHHQLHNPENAYLVEAAKIEDLSARKKFLDEKASCENTSKLLHQLQLMQNPPLPNCPK